MFAFKDKNDFFKIFFLLPDRQRDRVINKLFNIPTNNKFRSYFIFKRGKRESVNDNS